MPIRWLLFVPLMVLLGSHPALSQAPVAPNISGPSAQGGTVDLADFRGDRNVLVVFYRLHS